MNRSVLAVLLLALSAAPSHAHLDPLAHGSLAAGLTHPLSGLDHVLAMITVGLWAALLGGRAVWLVPAAFVGTMALGYGAALAGLPLLFVEPTILASVVVLGLLVAIAAPVPVGTGMAIVAAFALFHGYAHASEIGAAGAVSYGLGFATATALLHATGATMALALLRLLGDAHGRLAARVAGGLAVAGGVALAISA
jgi:urease accessory protein